MSTTTTTTVKVHPVAEIVDRPDGGASIQVTSDGDATATQVLVAATEAWHHTPLRFESLEQTGPDTYVTTYVPR